MPRRLTTFLPGHYYHIYNRGNNRQAIFFEPENYLYFLHGVKRYLVPVMDILAYCLMPTHYHLLVRVKEVALGGSTSEGTTPESSEVSETSELSGVTSLAVSRAMQRLSISYTRAINKRYDRVGSLFQGAFQAKAVTTDAHLRHLCVYIHANPVKDGLVADPADWPYSNYLEWVGLRDGQLVDHDFVHALYLLAPEESHRQAVLHYLKTLVLPEDIRRYLEGFEG